MAPRSRRPFYAEYAWAYNLLIDRPIRKECGSIATWFRERGVLPGSAVLDAGCGTGRYAIELGRRGYVVHGVDRSPELIAVARRAAGTSAPAVTFRVRDMSVLPPSRYEGVLCRGVLNDLVDDKAREVAFRAFGRALRPAGVFVLDVREWEATAERKAREPLFRKSVATDRGALVFTSVTRLEPESRKLLISERHAITIDGTERSQDYEFAMQCWTRGELEVALRRQGFEAVMYFGAYDPAVPAGATDRLVAVAQRSRGAS